MKQEKQENLQGITIKIKLDFLGNPKADEQFQRTAESFTKACNFISTYIFDNGFPLSYPKLCEILYYTIRKDYGLKAMMAQSAIKTVVARYKTLKTQMKQKPFRYQDENGVWQKIPRTLEWLEKPIQFKSNQFVLLRGRDWSRTKDGFLSLNTSDGRIYAVPKCKGFDKYFDGTWKFGAAVVFKRKDSWYFYLTATKPVNDIPKSDYKHIVGIDRGLRFLAVSYDEKGKTKFYSGKEITRKRESYNKVRKELQEKGTKSARRVLKRISGRENRWMADVNHCISKTLVQTYGENTLFVLEDLTNISLSEKNLKSRNRKSRNNLRSWTFYQLEQFLSYKARLCNSSVLYVSAKYTSQRCPKCGSIHEENRKHEIHAYICNNCGYRSNDDRVGAMNIQHLGTRYVSGEDFPSFRKPAFG